MFRRRGCSRRFERAKKSAARADKWAVPWEPLETDPATSLAGAKAAPSGLALIEPDPLLSIS
jgi:hypothetical protein